MDARVGRGRTALLTPFPVLASQPVMSPVRSLSGSAPGLPRGRGPSWVVAALLLASCARAKAPQLPADVEARDGGSPTSSGGLAQAAERACPRDHVREYACEELVPRRSSHAAPPPYENCPAVIANPPGTFRARALFGVFDADYTAYIRRRQPPGHSCCFSWCSPVELTDPERVDPQARCDSHRAERETFCFAEPEGGTSASAPGEFSRCPHAIRPPAAGAFFVPREGVLLDPMMTAERRGQGTDDCCYAWCSVVPGVAEPKRRLYTD
jgi:hypothetical protein